MTDILAIANKAAEQDTTPGTGSFTKELPRAGVAFLRLVRYIELGLHAPKDPTHKPARRVRLEFDLVHPDHMITGKKQDGTDFAFPNRLVVNANIGGPKSRYGKLFAKMNYKGDAEFMYQLLGRGFLGAIHHKKDGDKTYVNLDNNGEWTIGEPVYVDPMTNVAQAIAIPESETPLQMFLYEKDGLDDSDIKALWDSIYIETPEGAEKSYNWIQETIMESIDWADSRTCAVVSAGGVLDVAGTVAPETTEAAADEAPAAENTVVDMTKTAVPADNVADAAAEAALAAVGLSS